jgi:hypothetical protein
MLHRLEEINIRGCEKIKSLSGLSKLKKLTMNKRNHIAFDKETLQLLLKLDIGCDSNIIFMGVDFMLLSIFKFWKNPDILMKLQNLRDLTIRNVAFLHDFPFMAGLRSLCITSSDRIVGLSLPAMPSLAYVEISRCNNLDSFRIRGNSRNPLKFPVYSLTIRDCFYLKKMFIHRKVFKAQISGHLLKTVEVTEQIGHLKLSACSNYFREIINRPLVMALELSLLEENKAYEMIYAGSDSSDNEGNEGPEFDDDEENEDD